MLLAFAQTRTPLMLRESGSVVVLTRVCRDHQEGNEDRLLFISLEIKGHVQYLFTTDNL
jgi:hypothetical protein